MEIMIDNNKNGEVLLKDLYETIKKEVENKELAEFIVKVLKDERKATIMMTDYVAMLKTQIEQLKNQTQKLENQNKGIEYFSNGQLLDEIFKRLNKIDLKKYKDE